MQNFKGYKKRRELRIKARAKNYDHLFDIIGNNIKLKEESQFIGNNAYTAVKSNLKLHEAMALILRDVPNRSMNAKTLSDIIYKQVLYRKQDGGKANAWQIKARAKNYDHLFDIIGDSIKLKD
jgi:hypothetical protein